MLIKKYPITKKASFSFKPDFIADNVSGVDFSYLKKLGITTCFIDLDGTVVERKGFEIDSKLSKKLKESGLDIKIATNRPRSRSLKSLKDNLHASGVIHPVGLFGKPSKRYVYNALKEYGLKRGEVVMIGDRYIQDILGANRSGIYSLLVHKLGKSYGRADQIISDTEKKMTEKLSVKYIDLTK